MEFVWQTAANPSHRQDYIFREGIRYVRPYYFEFISYAKNRWIGKTIVDLFEDEFKGRTRDYYVSAVKAGRIQVDGKIIPISHVIRSSQKISHFLHRHEPPVLAGDVQILHTEPDVLTVFKPSLLPVHPCGQYRKNTILGILEAEHGLGSLFPIHRLDRLVSGLLIIARTASKAETFRQQIMSGEVKKQYIARVMGVFPENEQVVNAHINHNVRTKKCTAEEFDARHMQEENGGQGNTRSKGKTACTKFTRISTDGIHSIVSCEPITGRTHQIRVHLQFTGHPIANDILYQSNCVSDPSSVDNLRADAESEISADETNEDFGIDHMCINCPHLGPRVYDKYEEGLWLHCVKYSGPGWAYQCPYPEWATLG